jgi:fatty acid desaturase
MEKKIDWYRTPVDKNLLTRLTGRSDARGLLQSGSFLLIFLGSVLLSWYFFARQWWVPTAAAVAFNLAFHGFMGMEAAVHELSHGTPFKSRWLNELFYGLFSFLSWNNGVHFRASHMLHHRYTVHRGLDKEVVLEPISLTLLDFVSWFTFDFRKFWMLMLPTVAHAFGNADQDFFLWDPLFPPGDARRRRMCSWARFVLAGHLALLGVFAYYQLWVLIAVVTFGSFFCTFLSRGCVIQQHLGLCPNVPDWRVSCHTVEFGPLMGYLYWHMNYHREHHMFAAVPFFSLRKLHEAVAFDFPAPVKGYLAGVGKILSLRRRQRDEPGFCFVPEFPPAASPPRMGPGR